MELKEKEYIVLLTEVDIRFLRLLFPVGNVYKEIDNRETFKFYRALHDKLQKPLEEKRYPMVSDMIDYTYGNDDNFVTIKMREPAKDLLFKITEQEIMCIANTILKKHGMKELNFECVRR